MCIILVHAEITCHRPVIKFSSISIYLAATYSSPSLTMDMLQQDTMRQLLKPITLPQHCAKRASPCTDVMTSPTGHSPSESEDFGTVPFKGSLSSKKMRTFSPLSQSQSRSHDHGMASVPSINLNDGVESEEETIGDLPSCMLNKLTEFDTVPIIDLYPFMHGTAEEKAKAAQELGEACHNIGFLYIKNHGISQARMDEVYASARQFFDLPTEEKMKLSMKAKKSARGYFSVKEENLNVEGLDCKESKKRTAGDLKEGFDIGNEDTVDVTSENPFYQPNLFPSKEVLPEYEATMRQYYDEVKEVALTLCRAFALSLNLPEHFFDEKSHKPMATLRTLHYPPQPRDDKSSFGCGPHTDYGCCTILAQDDTGGLQVRSGEKWINVPPIPGTFVVNIGDMMSRWTGNVYRSTVHRVMNESGSERYSIPFFFNPDAETEVQVLSNCKDRVTTDSTLQQVVAKTCGDILFERYAPTFAHIKK
eukprot:GFYU01004138.1.p1 GENE.GFYU01004138.1~~GFYU01004138.1.p1  ORF type:complete len:477 (-),score=112.61 GFYU01004138.1:191-1621(-)